MGWLRFLFRRNRFIQVNPCSLSHLPHAHGLEGNSYLEMAIAGSVIQLQFSSVLDKWFPRIKVLRALNQEMGETRQGEEDMRNRSSRIE